MLPPGQLHVLVNTGDDFRHLGLYISPDIDTLLYTLAGRANKTQGWGLAGETWQTMTALEQLGGATWFRLGDRDLATHLWRTQRLAEGAGLAELTAELAAALGIASHIYPMTDEPVSTSVCTDQGDLPFQQYFVRQRCEPIVRGFNFEGISAARPDQKCMSLLQRKQFEAVVICPSNPFVSVDPILQVPGLWPVVRDSPAPVVLVSPIVAGQAIKGPAAKMMRELGIAVTALGVARHYCARYPGLVDYFVMDESDATLVEQIRELGMAVAITSTIMKSREDKQQLARFCLQLTGT